MKKNTLLKIIRIHEIVFHFKLKYFFLLITFSFISHLCAQPGIWTWMHGSNTPNATGNFGTIGVASPTNEPPALYEACEWTDSQGRFWLYGGVLGSNYNASLWMYNTTTNMWTWVNGPSGFATLSPVYGIQGIPSPTNTPGARGYATITWVDAQDNLWLFGGDNGTGLYSDLWKYNITTNMWTWVSGSTILDQTGVYGTLLIPSITNYPSSRQESSASWLDNSGNLWLFGGGGPIGDLNDLWKYNPLTNEWTWMRGSNTPGSLGSYGTMGISSSTNDPPARLVYSKWKDKNGNLWMFGGGGLYNDLWKYTLTTNQWTWIRGSNITNPPNTTTPIKCQPSANDDPPARMESRACWVDYCGNFWMFGGNSSIFLNDLWHYNVQTNIWTFVNGNISGSYGTISVPLISNQPPVRHGAIPFTEKNGNLWLFGGAGGTFAGPAVYNDLWRYVIDSNCVKWCAPPIIPTASFSGTNLSGCANLTVNFTNTSTNATSWNWAFGDGNTSTTQNPNHTYTSPGQYTVTLIASNGTTSATSISVNYVTVYVNAVAAFTPTTYTLCLGQSVTFNNSSINSNASFWNFGDGNFSTAISPIHTYGSTGNYTVTLIAQNVNGCNDTITQNIFVTGANVTAGNPLTLNCITPSGTITASSAAANVTYSWAGSGIVSGNFTSSPTVNATGTYTVIVTDPVSGCTNSATVVVSNSSVSFANVSPDVTIQLGASTTLTATGGGTYYNWFPTTNLNPTTGNTVTANPNQTTTYCVEVTDNNGCKDTACVTVSVEIPCPTNENLQVPNAFSPNEDGMNDEFCLQGWNACIINFEIIIFNRWGEKVFESTNPDFCWDGKYLGTAMDAQVFVYYIKATFENVKPPIIKKGNISLIK